MIVICLINHDITEQLNAVTCNLVIKYLWLCFAGADAEGVASWVNGDA